MEGRDDGMLRYGRTSIHAHAIGDVLASSAPVTEPQVRQTERGIDVAVVAAPGLDQTALTAALAGTLRRAGLPDPEVTLHAVAAIPRHPDTGKTRRFIPSRNDAGAQNEEGQLWMTDVQQW